MVKTQSKIHPLTSFVPTKISIQIQNNLKNFIFYFFLISYTTLKKFYYWDMVVIVVAMAVAAVVDSRVLRHKLNLLSETSTFPNY